MAGKLAGLLGTIAAEARPRLNNVLHFAKVELTPPTPGDIVGIKNGIQNLLSGFRSQRWRNLTVKEAWLNTLVATEVLCWFYIGECIGKRHIVGYDV